MNRRTLLLGTGGLLAAAPDTLNPLLAELAGPGRDSLGAVAAVVEAGQTTMAAAGESGATGGPALDGDTVFEVGSITKVFTALLLAEMVQRGQVGWGDPVARFLPPNAQPRGQGRNIRLLDLATYMSGLPRMPSNFRPADPANPYADYGQAQLYAAVSRAPPHSPGERYEYSNLGFGLLGHVLSLQAGCSYEELVVERICDPLGLDSTRMTLSPALQARLAPGHDADLTPVPNWGFQVLAGAGALRSTVHDLLRFLRACQDTSQGGKGTPLADALGTLLFPRRYVDKGNQVAAGWFIRRGPQDEIVWKDGGTGGYASFIGYSTRSGRAAVVLSNTAARTVPQFGLHLVNPSIGLPIMQRHSAVQPASLAALAGRYALAPDFVLNVTPGDGRLVVQATGQPALQAYPATRTRFFLRAVDAQLTFELGAEGRAAAVVLHQNGRDQRGTRLP